MEYYSWLFQSQRENMRDTYSEVDLCVFGIWNNLERNAAKEVSRLPSLETSRPRDQLSRLLLPALARCPFME